uniref:Non-structural polyprotein 1AB n=1 Tax=Beihai tree frog astrovirus TaxID=2116129 RepID=A0A2P1GMH1_9VIRU|nr:ORF1ab [Beihai tree frog astrovirus]
MAQAGVSSSSSAAAQPAAALSVVSVPALTTTTPTMSTKTTMTVTSTSSAVLSPAPATLYPAVYDSSKLAEVRQKRKATPVIDRIGNRLWEQIDQKWQAQGYPVSNGKWHAGLSSSEDELFTKTTEEETPLLLPPLKTTGKRLIFWVCLVAFSLFVLLCTVTLFWGRCEAKECEAVVCQAKLAECDRRVPHLAADVTRLTTQLSACTYNLTSVTTDFVLRNITAHAKTDEANKLTVERDVIKEAVRVLEHQVADCSNRYDALASQFQTMILKEHIIVRVLSVPPSYWHYGILAVVLILYWLVDTPTVGSLIVVGSQVASAAGSMTLPWTLCFGSWTGLFQLDWWHWPSALSSLAARIVWCRKKVDNKFVWDWRCALAVLIPSLLLMSLSFALDYFLDIPSASPLMGIMMTVMMLVMKVSMRLALWSQGAVVKIVSWDGTQSTTHEQNWLQRLLWKHAGMKGDPAPQAKPRKDWKNRGSKEAGEVPVAPPADDSHPVPFVSAGIFTPDEEPETPQKEANVGSPWISWNVAVAGQPWDVCRPGERIFSVGKAFPYKGALITPEHVWEAATKPQVLKVLSPDGAEHQLQKRGTLSTSGEKCIVFDLPPGVKSLKVTKERGTISVWARTNNGTPGKPGVTWGLANTVNNTHNVTTSPGDSGTPLLDENGHLVAIHVAATSSRNLSVTVTEQEALTLPPCECEGDCCCDLFFPEAKQRRNIPKNKQRKGKKKKKLLSDEQYDDLVNRGLSTDEIKHVVKKLAAERKRRGEDDYDYEAWDADDVVWTQHNIQDKDGQWWSFSGPQDLDFRTWFIDMPEAQYESICDFWEENGALHETDFQAVSKNPIRPWPFDGPGWTELLGTELPRIRPKRGQGQSGVFIEHPQGERLPRSTTKQYKGKRKIQQKEPEGPWNQFAPAEWDERAFSKTLEKHYWHVPSQPIDQAAWQYASNYIQELLQEHGQSDVISWEQVDKPDDTSPGYPLFLEYNTSQDVYSEEPWLCHEVWNDLKDGYTPYWYVFLKQEQLNKQKIADGDIRAIYVPPDPFSRCQARFDQHLNAKLKENRFLNHIAIGMNPFTETDALVRSMGDPISWAERDYKRFDGTIPATVLYEIRYQRWLNLKPHYQTDENWKVYESITHGLVQKQLLHPNGEVHTVLKGNPSGQMSTSIDNCLVNIFVSQYVSYVCYGKGLFSLMTYGDDSLVGYDVVPDPELEEEVFRTTFGMALPAEKVKYQTTPVGLSFCGYYIKRKLGKYVPSYKPDRIIANIWRPVTPRSNDTETLWAQLISATLLLWETDYREIPYSLLRELYSDSPEFPVPPPRFFNKLFWEEVEEAQILMMCSGVVMHHDPCYENGRQKEEHNAWGGSSQPNPTQDKDSFQEANSAQNNTRLSSAERTIQSQTTNQSCEGEDGRTEGARSIYNYCRSWIGRACSYGLFDPSPGNSV